MLDGFTRRGLGYCFEPVDEDGSPWGVRLSIDFLSRHGATLSGRVTVESMITGSAGLLFTSALNLSDTAQERLAKRCARYDLGKPMSLPKWEELVLRFVSEVDDAESRPTEMPVRIGRLNYPRQQQQFSVWPLIARGKLNAFIGPGKSGKSFLAILCATMMEGAIETAYGLRAERGHVLYLDWEEQDDPATPGATVNERVQMVAAGLGIEEPPEILYLSCRRPITQLVAYLAQIVEENQIDLVIIDSVEASIGGESEHGTYEARFFGFRESIQEIGRNHAFTTLLIDHLSAGEVNSEHPGAAKAFGSIFKLNEVRWSWEVRGKQEKDSPYLQLGCFHGANNNGRKMGDMAFELDFSTEGVVRFVKTDVIENFAEKASRPDRIERAILAAPLAQLSVKELEDQLGDKGSAIRTELNRNKRRFIPLQNGRWGASAAVQTSPSSPDETWQTTASELDEIPFR